MKKAILLFSALACVLVLSISAVFAEETKNVDLEKIVVTPVRSEQVAYESASNVTVITAYDIAQSAAANVADLLQSEAGVFVSGYTGNRKTAKVDMRGFGETATSNVLVLVDGRKVNQIDMSGADWCQIPVESVDRIEILRGSASVLYGDNAVGGVVNIVTKKGKGVLKGNIVTSYRSYNAFSEASELSGSIKEFSYYLNAKYYDTKGYRENNAMRSKDFNGRFGYPLFERLNLDLSTGSHKDSYGMPGALSESDMGNLGRRQSTYMEDRALTKDRYIRLRLDADPVVNGSEIGNFVNDISFRRRKTYTSAVAWGVNSISQNKIHTLDFNSRYEKNLRADRTETKFIMGFDYLNADNELSGRGWSVDEIDISKESAGSYVYCEQKIDEKFIVSGGYRYEHNTYIFDQSSSQIKYTKREPSDSVVQASIAYLYDEGSSIFCDYKQSFRFPATDEWYINSGANKGLNENLQPQEGEQYEIGIKHALSDKMRFDTTAYIMNIKNEIYYNPATFFNENYDRTRHSGIETRISSELNDTLSSFFSYTYDRSKFMEGDYKNNDIPAVPRNKFSVGLKLKPAADCNVALIGNYIGSRYMISDQKNQVQKMDDYITIDGKLLYNIKDAEVSFAVNNIFDEKYSEYGVTNSSGTAKNYYPSPGRNFEVEVSYRF